MSEALDLILKELEKLKLPHATWRASEGTSNHYTGICQKCHHTVAAINLTLKRLPFGRGEQWQCADCLTRPRGE